LVRLLGEVDTDRARDALDEAGGVIREALRLLDGIADRNPRKET
jgi:hypothetical protein